MAAKIARQRLLLDRQLHVLNVVVVLLKERFRIEVFELIALPNDVEASYILNLRVCSSRHHLPVLEQPGNLENNFCRRRCVTLKHGLIRKYGVIPRIRPAAVHLSEEKGDSSLAGSVLLRIAGSSCRVAMR